ncbi:aminotransferase class V-fold PLP-dependent enzyme [Kordiimonas aquimaris]|uniref:aminotransferase class V-fold PLP-dependent enzyme n=1 Tax=Kordiimonas aquimaris TaxID=707591 RepID=UPI0021D02F35|nr:aminotransferase class V-fold PLP-dependent enzyme [Kordiimonas aquimaris]
MTNDSKINRSLSRRNFLSQSAAASVASLTFAESAKAKNRANQTIVRLERSLEDSARTESVWQHIASQYDVTDQITNLENGYWGIMARPVLDEYKQQTEWVNNNNTYFARRELGNTFDAIREKVAAFLNVSVDEIELTRGATETLQALIGGYNKLNAGDTVMYADLDYSEMKNAMRWLEDRRSVNVIKINFPEPTKSEPLTEDQIVDFYERSLNANPGTKLLLLTHLNNWTGLIIPVAKISAMAKARGVDVILDAAHSVGQVDFDIKSLGCNFVGVNLHKWVGAPIGCGVIYIQKDHISDIDTYMGKSPDSKSISARIDTGTWNFAAHMTIPKALEFHNLIGTAQKEARVRYLRSLWVNEIRGKKGITILTPDDPQMVAGLTSFRIDGVTSTQANNALMRKLADEYGVLTTRRTGPHAGDCIRVTPSFYNTPKDMRKLVAALNSILADI